MSELIVWMNGVEVATWQEPANAPPRLLYATSWLNSAAPRPLSLSLPLLPEGVAHRGQVVMDYFDNLLPDNTAIRSRIRNRFGTRSTGTFDLLQAIGRDCVGAVQLLPRDTAPADLHSIDFRPLSDADVAAVLRGVTALPVPGARTNDNDEFRISIAGAQEKTGLLRHGQTWGLPTGNTPSTHIFKLPLGLVGNMQADMQLSVENEWLCMHLLRAFGIPVANTMMGTFEDQRALIVERFDRRLANDGKWWLRLPQEDMCQVFGKPPSGKYEADGGPGILEIMDLLRQSEEGTDRATFFKTQILFWMLAATDGHAKNFSVHIESGGRFRLTPVYDVLSVYPILGRGPGKLDPHDAQLAMSLRGKNRHRKLLGIRRRHWNETARKCGIQLGAEPWIADLVARVEPAIEHVQKMLPPRFPQEVSEPVFTGLRDAAARLVAMPPDA
ncbi:MAG: type II toxin-antitoxin system HipA family toxin [Pseudomonas sp.]